MLNVDTIILGSQLKSKKKLSKLLESFKNRNTFHIQLENVEIIFRTI